MGLEIERKFLLKGPFKELATSSSHIIQGYMPTQPGVTVRVRIRDEKGFLTIKGNSSLDGLSRYEWEKGIPLSEANELLKLCFKGTIDKTRYLIPYQGVTYEVDEFHGKLEGFTLAEIELNDEIQEFPRAPFLGKEVTGNPHYYNSVLLRLSLADLDLPEK
ncbi:MAG: CYTH domain-containing protein [Bacteroidaceae bacterium]